jgi:TRAP-type C4-dicarboxylate transport system permease small subunit
VKKFSKYLAYLINSLAGISGIAILLITLIVTADVVMRYLLNSPLLFAGETCEFLLAILVFAGFAYTFQKGGHIRITLVIQTLSSVLRYWIRMITLCMASIYLIIFTWQNFNFIKECYLFNRTSTVLLFPIWIVQLSMLVGMLALLFAIFLSIAMTFRNRNHYEEE